MTRKKRVAPEPPGFENEKFEIETSSLHCKPKPSSKSRPAPPPPLPRKSIQSSPRKTSTASIIISTENLVENNRPAKTCHHKKPPGRITRLIRRDDFSDEDDFDTMSYNENSAAHNSSTGGPVIRRPSSGLESPNGSICTTDSGVNSDMDFLKARHFSPAQNQSQGLEEPSPTNSIVSQDSLEPEANMPLQVQVVDLDMDIPNSNTFTPPAAPPPMDYSIESPVSYDLSIARRPSQLDLIQEARRMLRKNQLSLARSPSPTETIASCWSDDSQAIFHINEKDDIPPNPIFDDDFAGVRMLGSESCSNTSTSTIRSHRGTIRGVKNRVRAGIATFLRDQKAKSLIDRESGKVVVYITTLGVIRETYARCVKVRQILRTLLIRVEEKDLFMSKENQQELLQRIGSASLMLPQVFVDGQFLGDAEGIEKLNESGELRQILKPYKSLSVTSVCLHCGGFRMLPCPVCNGSKKSVHRSDLLENLVALRCTHCNEAGLIKCELC